MKNDKSLGLMELIAIALGGMVGGGIFTILGISVSLIGNLTPIAIIIGGLIASLAAYSYVKLGLYYRDEGATYAFYKKTYPRSHFSAAVIGWFTIFGYISTLALYAYTFSSYAISGTGFADDIFIRKIIAIAVIVIFLLVNIWSVKGMGKIEDIMVYSKLFVLVLISVILIRHSSIDSGTFIRNMVVDAKSSSVLTVLIVASLTFVSYEGFQLVINAVNEMKSPETNIPRAIYSSIILAILIYVILAIGALLAIPSADIIRDKEYALAAGASNIIGNIGAFMVIFGALLATSSAISGTVFGSSRQMAEIAGDGYFPLWLSFKKAGIPRNAIITMSLFACILITVGGLQLILEFGSITFLMVSLLMALANYKMKKETNSSSVITILAIFGLSTGGLLILFYEFSRKWEQMLIIIVLYILLATGAWLFSKYRRIEAV